MPHVKPFKNIAIRVIGAGSWGTTLANLLAVKGYAVDLWAYEKEVEEQITADRENRMFLPNIWHARERPP